MCVCAVNVGGYALLNSQKDFIYFGKVATWLSSLDREKHEGHPE